MKLYICEVFLKIYETEEGLLLLLWNPVFKIII